jgi:phosphoribosylanthranilate isomerase
LAEAVRIVGPDAVDVSSGVELSLGVKDPARLIRFLEIARDANPAA